MVFFNGGDPITTYFGVVTFRGWNKASYFQGWHWWRGPGHPLDSHHDKAPLSKDSVPGYVSGLSAQEASLEVGKWRQPGFLERIRWWNDPMSMGRIELDIYIGKDWTRCKGTNSYLSECFDPTKYSLGDRMTSSWITIDCKQLFLWYYLPWNQHSTWKWMVGILAFLCFLLGWPIFRGYVSFRECIT